MAIYELDGIAPEFPSNGRYWVAESADLIGRVHLAEDTSIWFNAVLRGDNEPIRIGARTNIQDGCIMHTDMGFPLTVGENCVIGHGATLHGCTVGDGTLVGMGATVMNGAVVGRNCMIGAHALIGEGKEIPDNCLVFGAPGKVVRQLTDEQVARIRAGADQYVAKRALYTEKLRKIG